MLRQEASVSERGVKHSVSCHNLDKPVEGSACHINIVQLSVRQVGSLSSLQWNIPHIFHTEWNHSVAGNYKVRIVCFVQ